MHLLRAIAGLLMALPIASAFDEVFCVTELGFNRVQHVRRTTITSTLNFELHETCHEKTTSTTTPVISATVTETNTAYTTASTITDTFSMTVTNTATETDTTTATDSTSTVIIETVTTTPVMSVPSPPYFTPILSEAEVMPSERRKYRRHGQGKNDFLNAEERNSRALQPFGRNRDGSKQCRAQYPQFVQCVKIKENFSVERTTTTKTKTIVAKTATVTVTDTTTTTNTIVPPDVPTTITDTTSTTTTVTETDTTTSTSTETDTTTVAAPTATSYAQCQSDNVVSLIGGRSIISSYGFTSYSTLSGISSAQSCCEACAVIGNACSNFAFGEGSCYVINGPNTCAGHEGYTEYNQLSSDDGVVGYVIGNGACGLTSVSSLG